MDADHKIMRRKLPSELRNSGELKLTPSAAGMKFSLVDGACRSHRQTQNLPPGGTCCCTVESIQPPFSLDNLKPHTTVALLS